MKINPSSLKHVIKNATLPGPPSDTLYQSTCVFLLLFDMQEPHLLAILKSDNEGYPWRNQVALPGGHLDKDDASSVDTAYRELKEELNITRDQVELIGSRLTPEKRVLIEDDVEKEIREAIAFAEESPFTDAAELYTDIYG